ncbi:hypothetical protein B0T14DRAFT_567428 [Immersiella caudata]|uniref:Uncharacterized protein n=1 Tax=Immersiella caudata TaxID=314043 RepID=A0AA39WSC3_9PEZI|nr:hypothetical protein B0T14DRAFT_567428 [Immersiella caudata]
MAAYPVGRKNPFDPEFFISRSGERLQVPVETIRGPGLTKEEQDRDATQAANWENPSEGDPVWEAIRNDDVDRLREVLELALFYHEVATPGSILLRKNDGTEGIHQLLNLCIKASAVSCLYHLTLWCQSPQNVFKYDFPRLYDSAKKAAVQTGRFACLLALDIAVIEEPKKRKALLALLLTRAHSADAVTRIVDLWKADDLDYFPYLLLKSADSHSQPALIEALADALERKTDINEAGSMKRMVLTPIAAAAGMLNVSALDMLIEMRADPFAAPYNHTDRNRYHPLYCALSQNPPLALPPGSPLWRAAIRPVASRMHTATDMLLASASPAFRNTPSYKRILARGTLIYLCTLRTFLLRALLHLPSQDLAVRNELILSPCQLAGNSHDDEIPTAFLPDVSHFQLRDALKKLGMQLHRDFIDLWMLLLTPELIEAVERHIQRPFNSRPLSGEDCLLALILAKERVVDDLLKGRSVGFGGSRRRTSFSTASSMSESQGSVVAPSTPTGSGRPGFFGVEMEEVAEEEDEEGEEVERGRVRTPKRVVSSSNLGVLGWRGGSVTTTASPAPSRVFSSPLAQELSDSSVSEVIFDAGEEPAVNVLLAPRPFKPSESEDIFDAEQMQAATILMMMSRVRVKEESDL